jgi:hypothetical protein
MVFATIRASAVLLIILFIVVYRFIFLGESMNASRVGVWFDNSVEIIGLLAGIVVCRLD